MQNVVTGGAGFIGSHLSEALLEKGHRVRIVDDFSTGKAENIELLAARFSGALEVVEEDVCNDLALKQALEGADFVFHLAAMTSVEESVQNPDKVDRANIGGTVAVLKSCREVGVRKVVFASSTAVYGNAPGLPKVETQPVEPNSPYAVTKLAGEHYCRVFSEVFQVPTVCLRFFNVYGPRQDPASPYAAVVPRFVDRLLRGKPPIVFGDGEQTRDFVFVNDVVQANLKAAESEVEGIVLNVASGRSRSLNELLNELASIHGSKVEPVFREPRLGEVRHSSASVELARKTIGYAPSVELAVGLRRTVEWFSARQGLDPAD
jgi:nucleoside-diphosphate-sugar epimerase